MAGHERREFLKAIGAAASLASLGRLAAAQPAVPGGRLLGTLDLGNPDGGRHPPLDTLLGSGLDARQFATLSSLSPDTLVTPNARFFVRTAAPRAVQGPAASWAIQTGGLVREPRAVRLASLASLVRPVGTHLLECAGNADPSNFGLMSVAAWDGIPLAPLLESLGADPRAPRVLVSGVDDLNEASVTSVPGASWIFSRDDLVRSGAFLATRMNGEPLPPHHGAPVRLVVPGWYGCACIKWVDRIDLMADEVAATPQMREFAQRTHQPALTGAILARDFTPAVIDTAAMPIRVEQWAVSGRLVYRIIGVIWGGATPTNALQLRLKGNAPWMPVDDCPLPSAATMWSLWTHSWRPDSPGRYQIALRVTDPGIRTRRLDVFFYAREVNIDEI